MTTCQPSHFMPASELATMSFRLIVVPPALGDGQKNFLRYHGSADGKHLTASRTDLDDNEALPTSEGLETLLSSPTLFGRGLPA